MRRYASFAAALLGSTAIASAADLYTPPPITPEVVYTPAPAFNWTGIYAGIHAGFGGDRFEYPYSIDEIFAEDFIGEELFDDITGQFDLTSSGFFAGGQIGANWQFAPQWVVGVEADAAWSDIKGELGLSVDECCAIFDGAGIKAGSELNWFGTIRGRVGFLPTPRLMVYGTGGVAVGETESYLTGSDDLGFIDISSSSTNWGWTAGAGVEYAVTNNITLKTEYLYVDLGSHSLISSSDTGGIFSLDADTHFHTIKAGLNFLWGDDGGAGADLAYYEPPASTDPFSWTGFYAGVHGGYGGNKFDYPLSISEDGVEGIIGLLDAIIDDFDPEEDLPEGFELTDINADANITSSGFFGGGQIGANWQFAPQWVAGVEADAAWSGIKGELGFELDPIFASGLDIEAGSQINWFGTLRGRVGFLPTERLMVYGTGGLAVGETESYLNFGGTLSGGVSDTATNWGWSAGGGFEYAITDNLTFKTEYLYVDLGSHELVNFGDSDLTLDVDSKFHTVKAGLNVLFN